MTTLDEPQATENPRPAHPRLLVDDGYLTQSAQPLTSLLFVLPLLVVYELGIGWYQYDPDTYSAQRILAFSGMQNFFQLLGATGRFMPAAAVVAILLVSHLFRPYRWHVTPSVFWRMLLESGMYALPLVGLGYLLQHYLLLHEQTTGIRGMLVMSLGAGVYEELVFRLAMYALLSLIFVDICQLPKAVITPLIVTASGILFSVYHYWGDESYHLESFVFRALAGIYFGAIFLTRGFGLTVGAHASYDVIATLLRSA